MLAGRRRRCWNSCECGPSGERLCEERLTLSHKNTRMSHKRHSQTAAQPDAAGKMAERQPEPWASCKKNKTEKKQIDDKWGSIQTQHLKEVTVLNVPPPPPVWWRTAWRHAAAVAPPLWWTRAISTLTWRTASCSGVRSDSCWPWDAPCSPLSRVRTRASVGSPVCVKRRALHISSWFLYIYNHVFFSYQSHEDRASFHFSFEVTGWAFTLWGKLLFSQ